MHNLITENPFHALGGERKNADLVQRLAKQLRYEIKVPEPDCSFFCLKLHSWVDSFEVRTVNLGQSLDKCQEILRCSLSRERAFCLSYE